jgi:thiamine transport system substrate-binding protein
VFFADPQPDEAPTGVIEASCFRQVEFVGILAGTEHEAEAQQLVDFLLSPRSRRTCR